MKIQIQKSPTADTRTCDWSKVTKEQLRHSSEQHIADAPHGEWIQSTDGFCVKRGMTWRVS